MVIGHCPDGVWQEEGEQEEEVEEEQEEEEEDYYLNLELLDHYDLSIAQAHLEFGYLTP